MGITIVGLGAGKRPFPNQSSLGNFEPDRCCLFAHRATSSRGRLASKCDCHSFDHIYETADSFATVYDTHRGRALQRAQEAAIVYAVPGHPFVGESTVTKLVAQAESVGLPVEIVAGLSFVEPCLTAVQQDGMAGVQIFDAIELTQYHYPPVNPDFPLLLGQVYSRMLANELKLVLTAVYPDEHPVTLSIKPVMTIKSSSKFRCMPSTAAIR